MKKRRLQLTIYLLPSLFTTVVLFLGFFSIVKTVHSLETGSLKFVGAAVVIIIAAFFDGLDGRVARLTKTSTRFGLEYDSLSDLIAFGAAPAILMYGWGLKEYGRIGWLAAFLYVACTALRLARFNVQAQTVERKHFQGLPCPMAAGFVASTILFLNYISTNTLANHFVIVAQMYGLAFLMVSNVRYRSFKDVRLFNRKSFAAPIILVILLIIIAAHPEVMLFMMSGIYVSWGILSEVVFQWKKRLNPASVVEEPSSVHSSDHLHSPHHTL